MAFFFFKRRQPREWGRMKTKPNPGLKSLPLRTAHNMFGVEENEMAGEVRFQKIPNWASRWRRVHSPCKKPSNEVYGSGVFFRLGAVLSDVSVVSHLSLIHI